MAYTNHDGALWRWRRASELGVDHELKQKFKHLRQPITRPGQDNYVKVDPAVRAYLLSISDSPVTDNRTYQDKS